MRSGVKDRKLYFGCQQCGRSYEADGDSIQFCRVRMKQWDPEMMEHIDGEQYVDAVRLCPKCRSKIPAS